MEKYARNYVMGDQSRLKVSVEAEGCHLERSAYSARPASAKPGTGMGAGGAVRSSPGRALALDYRRLRTPRRRNKAFALRCDVTQDREAERTVAEPLLLDVVTTNTDSQGHLRSCRLLVIVTMIDCW